VSWGEYVVLTCVQKYLEKQWKPLKNINVVFYSAYRFSEVFCTYFSGFLYSIKKRQL